MPSAQVVSGGRTPDGKVDYLSHRPIVDNRFTHCPLSRLSGSQNGDLLCGERHEAASHSRYRMNLSKVAGAPRRHRCIGLDIIIPCPVEADVNKRLPDRELRRPMPSARMLVPMDEMPRNARAVSFLPVDVTGELSSEAPDGNVGPAPSLRRAVHSSFTAVPPCPAVAAPAGSR